MIMNNCLRFSRSKYPMRGISLIVLLLFFVVMFGGIVGWRVYLYKYIPKNFLLIYIYSIILLYYVGTYKSKRRQLSNVEYISEHSKKCLKRTKQSLYYMLYLLLAVIMFVVFPTKMDDSDVLNLSLLAFIGIVGYLLMNYQFIVGFGSAEYISGDGKLCYNEIDKIEEVRRVPTVDGVLVYTKIVLSDNMVCYDKFLTDEYVFLLTKIVND